MEKLRCNENNQIEIIEVKPVLTPYVSLEEYNTYALLAWDNYKYGKDKIDIEFSKFALVASTWVNAALNNLLQRLGGLERIEETIIDPETGEEVVIITGNENGVSEILSDTFRYVLKTAVIETIFALRTSERPLQETVQQITLSSGNSSNTFSEFRYTSLWEKLPVMAQTLIRQVPLKQLLEDVEAGLYINPSKYAETEKLLNGTIVPLRALNADKCNVSEVNEENVIITNENTITELGPTQQVANTSLINKNKQQDLRLDNLEGSGSGSLAPLQLKVGKDLVQTNIVNVEQEIVFNNQAIKDPSLSWEAFLAQGSFTLPTLNGAVCLAIGGNLSRAFTFDNVNKLFIELSLAGAVLGSWTLGGALNNVDIYHMGNTLVLPNQIIMYGTNILTGTHYKFVVDIAPATPNLIAATTTIFQKLGIDGSTKTVGATTTNRLWDLQNNTTEVKLYELNPTTNAVIKEWKLPQVLVDLDARGVAGSKSGNGRLFLGTRDKPYLIELYIDQLDLLPNDSLITTDCYNIIETDTAASNTDIAGIFDRLYSIDENANAAWYYAYKNRYHIPEDDVWPSGTQFRLQGKILLRSSQANTAFRFNLYKNSISPSNLLSSAQGTLQDQNKDYTITLATQTLFKGEGTKDRVDSGDVLILTILRDEVAAATKFLTIQASDINNYEIQIIQAPALGLNTDVVVNNSQVSGPSTTDALNTLKSVDEALGDNIAINAQDINNLENGLTAIEAQVSSNTTGILNILNGTSNHSAIKLNDEIIQSWSDISGAVAITPFESVQIITQNNTILQFEPNSRYYLTMVSPDDAFSDNINLFFVDKTTQQEIIQHVIVKTNTGITEREINFLSISLYSKTNVAPSLYVFTNLSGAIQNCSTNIMHLSDIPTAVLIKDFQSNFLTNSSNITFKTVINNNYKLIIYKYKKY